MGYYVRLLTPSKTKPTLRQLQDALKSFRAVSLTVEEGDSRNWKQLLLAHSDDSPIAVIERNAVRAGELGAEEIEEFHAEINDCLPRSAADWLQEYLKSVKWVYAFQVLSGTGKRDGWQAMYAVRNAIREVVGGIMQADFEGFSNEEGYHILWQFDDAVKGPWWMAVLRDGEWVTFQMQLENPKHREAFLQGKVPPRVKPGRA